MRVGVFRGTESPTNGGSWTFVTLITEALGTAPGPHEFFLLDDTLPAVAPDLNDNGSGRSIATLYLRNFLSSCINLARTMLHKYTLSRRRDIKFKRFLEEQIDRHKLDIIWFVTLPLGGVPSIPFIATVWDLEHRKQPYFPEVSVAGWTWAARDKFYRSILPRATYVITGTNTGKEEIVRYYNVNPENVEVISFPAPAVNPSAAACDFEWVRSKYSIKDNFIFYPAQFWPHKNHFNLLRALDLLRKNEGIRLDLVLTGSDKGNREYVHTIVQKLNLSSAVFDLGFVSREELTSLYLNAVALVFPSFFGPDNFPPLEAFSLGCPVAAANVPGAKEQLGNAALLFAPTEPEDIADKILEIWKNLGCRERLILEGKKICQQRSSQAYVQSVCRLIDEFEPIRRCWGETYRPL
jgi:glycosyltransferase involved in cell wall biosynthesis